MARLNISSGSLWEEVVGYCRAVRIGDVVEVAGTVASGDDGQVVGRGDAALQTRFIFTKIEKALNEAGASLSDVVRTRMFVTDISQFELIGRVHGDFFRDVRPVSTMVEVAALVSPDYLIEIEVTARLGG